LIFVFKIFEGGACLRHRISGEWCEKRPIRLRVVAALRWDVTPAFQERARIKFDGKIFRPDFGSSDYGLRCRSVLLLATAFFSNQSAIGARRQASPLQAVTKSIGRRFRVG
jgi:hypothetical protein